MKQVAFSLSLFFLLFGCNNNSTVLEKQARNSADSIMENYGKKSTIANLPSKSFDTKSKEILSYVNEICDWKSAKGGYKRDHRNLTPNGLELAFVYEYFLDCDSLRFALVYNTKTEPYELIRIRVELVEEFSIYK